MSANFVSVIIPVFNDSERLKICLQALEKQSYSKELYEIIVVDNASKEDIKSVVSQFSQARYAYESKPGSYSARNQGISVAKGEILAFTDADCIPDSDWIEKGVSCLVNTPNCGLVAGRIDLFFQKPEQPNIFELYDCIEMSFSQERFIREDGFGATANIFTFKHIIDNVGCFDSTLKSGGDRQFGKQITAGGYKAVYADDARIAHPARYTFSQIRTRIIRFVGGSFDRMMAQNPSSIDIARDILDTFKPPFSSLYRAWRNKKLNSYYYKIQFISMMFVARYIVTSEKMRLYLGGKSQRE